MHKVAIILLLIFMLIISSPVRSSAKAPDRIISINSRNSNIYFYGVRGKSLVILSDKEDGIEHPAGDGKINDPPREDKEESEKYEDTPLSYSDTLLHDRFQYQIDTMITTYNNDKPAKISMPFLLRFTLADRWELRIYSNFLEYKSPYTGIDDITVALKWNFLRIRKVSMAVTAGMKCPSGTEHFSDDAFLGTLSCSLDWKLTDDFDVSLRGSWTNKVDYASDDTSDDEYYQEGKSAIKLGYKLNEKNYIYVDMGREFPDQSNVDFSFLTIGVGYTRELNKDTQLVLKITKGMTDADKNWIINAGFNYKM